MIESPCKKVCVLKNGMCIGCLRSISEISKWSNMNDLEKQKILDRINKIKLPFNNG